MRLTKTWVGGGGVVGGWRFFKKSVSLVIFFSPHPFFFPGLGLLTVIASPKPTILKLPQNLQISRKDMERSPSNLPLTLTQALFNVLVLPHEISLWAQNGVDMRSCHSE